MAAQSSDCLFCKIVAGSIPAKRVFEDEQSIAFADINPQAPTHLLIIPKEHVTSLADVAEDHADRLGHLVWVATELARTHQLAKGYRLVVNTGDDGGQTVHHLHMHLLGGRQMHWPPG
jgi:histidine triad (HIT) family protein